MKNDGKNYMDVIRTQKSNVQMEKNHSCVFTRTYQMPRQRTVSDQECDKLVELV